ncbi:MAG TPA: Ldh family oxidoreductase, partial [Chitinophagaceae bacterium]|nr:Ldh family oxidoreductase [Chitinophagaceae bacterium]
MTEQVFSYQQLFAFSKSILQKIGCSVNHAEIASRVLLSADLRGIDSHGVARLSGYVRLWEIDRVNAKPEIKVLHQTPSTAVVDGDRGL